MALTQQQVIDLYAGIVRRAPNASELTNGVNLTEATLSNQLFGEAQADVLPFIYFYQAAFNRIPETTYSTTNPQGLDFWVQTFRENFPAKKLWDYANEIVNTPEWNDNIGSLSTVAAITQIYQNVLGRNPDAAGLQYWTNAIETGVKSIVFVLYDISQSAEAVARNGAAAKNLLLEVANGTAELDGQGHLLDFAPPVDPDAPFALTSGVDIQTLSAGQKAVGGTDTYTDGDHITGTSNNTVELTLNGAISKQAQLTNVDKVVVQSQSGTSVNTSGWTGQKNITLDRVVADVTLTDVQASATQIDIVDANKAAKKITVTYDAQGITEANIGVLESYAAIKLGVEAAPDAAIKKINLKINDVAGRNSKLADLEGYKTETLKIDGGFAGGKFEIVGDLDATLTRLNAAGAKSDLVLKSTEADRKALDATFGSGNDTFTVGNTLNSNDKFDGGAGKDTLVATFTNVGTRVPTSVNIETFDLTFKGNASVDFAKVDSLEKIIVRESTNRFDLKNLDATFTNLEVHGKQAAGLQYVGYAEGEKNTKLAIDWINDSGNDVDAGQLNVDNAEQVVFTKSGEFDTRFVSKDPVVTNDAWQFDITDPTHPTTKILTVENTGTGDLSLLGNSQNSINVFGESRSSFYGLGNIGGTNAVTDLTFRVSDTGDIRLADVRNTRALQNLVLDASGNGDIQVNAIGLGFGLGFNNPPPFDAARDLRTVKLSATQGSEVTLHVVNALGDLSSPYISHGGTVNEIDIHAGNDSFVALDFFAAGDVAKTTINIENEAEVRVDTWLLVNAINEGDAGGTLKVTGAGELDEDGEDGYWVFAAQAISNQDFSGLTSDTAWVSFLNDTNGVKVIGTDNDLSSSRSVGDVNGVGSNYTGIQANPTTPFYGIRVTGDSFLGGEGNDNISAGGGNDFVFTGAGKGNIIDLGAGNDYVVIAQGAAATITTGAGNDQIFVNGTQAGKVTDFSLNNDKIVLDISNINSAIDFTPGNGVGSVNYSLVNGNGVDIDGVNYPAPHFQTIIAGNSVLGGTTTVINVSGTFDAVNDVQVAIQHGGQLQIATNGELNNPWAGGVGVPGNAGDALLLSWIDSAGDQHLSAARILDSIDLGGGLQYAYNFDVVDLIELTGTTSYLNQINLGYAG